MAVLVWIWQITIGVYGAGKASAVLSEPNLHLITASADKLASIVVVTFVLVFLVNEARRHMFNATVRGAAGQGLARMVGTHVAREVLSLKNLKPGRGRRETAAILMIDLQDFTRLSHQSDPSYILALLADYQKLVEPVITCHGGYIDKFMGDGILAHFGAIDPDATYAIQAMCCIEQLLFTMDKWNANRIARGSIPLHYRIACDIGSIVIGLVGAESKMEFTIIGDPVNLTAKMEKHSKKVGARALVTLRAFKIARHQGYRPLSSAKTISNAVIEGIAEPVDLVILSTQTKAAEKNRKAAA
jgi:adenylate cyclase